MDGSVRSEGRARTHGVVGLGLVLLVVAAADWSACRSSQHGSTEPCPADAARAPGASDPDGWFSEAESLRQHYEKHASERAVRRYCEAGDAWARAKDWESAARAMQKVGETLLHLGRLEAALRAFASAVSYADLSANRLLASDVRSDVGSARAFLSHSDALLRDASEPCLSALSLAREARGAREEARALGCSAEVEYHRGNLTQALDLFRSAEPLWERAQDPRGHAEKLLFEGTTDSDLSRFDDALAAYERALSFWASAGDKRGEAMTLVALGRLHLRQGQYQEALNHFRKGLDALEPLGDVVWEASGIAGLGSVYYDMGDSARAASYWEEALERYRAAGLQTAVLDLLLALGEAHIQLEDPSTALDRFREARTLAETIGSERWQAYSLQDMAVATELLGAPKRSLSFLERSLALQASVSDPRLEASILAEMGNAHDLLEDYDRALEYRRRTLALARSSGDRLGESAALFGLARTSRRKNELGPARDYVERALSIAESLRTEVASRELRTSYFASIYRYHELYIDVLMRLDQRRPRGRFAALAFRASERARARSLLDSLAEAEVDLRSGVAPELLERERSLKRQLDERAAAIEMSGRGGPNASKEIEDLEAQYQLVLAETRSESPRYAAVTQPRPIGVEEVQERLLDDDSLILEYALGEERSFLWAVSRDQSSSYSLAPRAEIERTAERVYELLTARTRVGGESLHDRNRRVEEGDARFREAAERLSEMVLGPVAHGIDGKRVVVVADGALQYVPFGVLPIPRRQGEPVPMIVEHEMVNLPSASTLAVLREQTRHRRPARGSVAVFDDPVFGANDPRLEKGSASATSAGPGAGSDSDDAAVHALRDAGILRDGVRFVPRLVGTRREAEAILASVPAETAFRASGFDASVTNVLNADLSSYRVVHFATHGVYNTETPALSGLILSLVDAKGKPQDGFLRLNDIYNMNLPVDLVVLSACNTALGRRVRGEGLVGIVRAFLYAGASRVVASLWKVDDESTSELMSLFYQGMFESHLSPPAALRRAQVTMWSRARSRSPYYWGAFVLQGEWARSPGTQARGGALSTERPGPSGPTR